MSARLRSTEICLRPKLHAFEVGVSTDPGVPKDDVCFEHGFLPFFIGAEAKVATCLKVRESGRQAEERTKGLHTAAEPRVAEIRFPFNRKMIAVFVCSEKTISVHAQTHEIRVRHKGRSVEVEVATEACAPEVYSLSKGGSQFLAWRPKKSVSVDFGTFKVCAFVELCTEEL